MKLSSLFSRSSGQSKRSKTAKKAPVASEAAPPTYISGHEGGDRVRSDLLSFADRSHHEANPYLSVIRALQNEPVAKKVGLKGLRMFGIKPAASGPDSLRPYALYELGFVSDPKRSARIARGLIKVEMFDKDGALLHRDAMADRVIERLRMRAFSGVKNLTAQEAKGVQVYLEGFMENLQLLGQELSWLPKHLRADWVYFADIVPTRRDSKNWMAAMQAHHVLDCDLLPTNGDVHFENFATYMNARYAQFNASWDSEPQNLLGEALNGLREALFPLPTYESSPRYRP